MEMINPSDKIVDLLLQSEKVLLTTHIFPDGDALGSQLGLGHALEAMGKEVYLYCEEPASYLLDFLPGCDKLIPFFPDDHDFDCAVSLDCGDMRRLGNQAYGLLEQAPFIVIDHHAGHQDFGDLRWVDAKRSSTGEMVYDLIRLLGGRITKDCAYCLYTAILTDTGSFRYDSTSPHTMRVAADLMEYGISVPEICAHIYDSYTKNRLQLLQKVLSTLELYEDDKIAVIRVTQELFEETETTGADTELFINFPRSLHSVKVAVFLKETADNLIGVSMRAKGDVDVSRVARSLGGGGHRNAAGFKLPDVSLDDLQQRLLAALTPLV
jgi:phosphoesterase RecJ-like protein